MKSKISQDTQRELLVRNDDTITRASQRFGTDIRDGWATKVDFSGEFIKYGLMTLSNYIAKR